jgi:hypothetical protein
MRRCPGPFEPSSVLIISVGNCAQSQWSKCVPLEQRRPRVPLPRWLC